jgi:hypothetical protein
MPVQGSLRDLSVLEVIQLIGTQRKTIALKVETADKSVFLHFRDGLLVAAHPRKPKHGLTFVELLIGLGHITPSDGAHMIERAREQGRDIWFVALEIEHLERETCERVYLRAVEAQLDRILLWEEGKFTMLPPGGVEELLRPGIAIDALLVDAMRRLDEMAAWKQGSLPPRAVPCLRGPDEWLVSDDPLRRAVVRQIDGRRTIGEVAEATRLGEHAVYEAIAAGVEAGWIQIMQPVTPAARPWPVKAGADPAGDESPGSAFAHGRGRGGASGAPSPALRRSPAVAVLVIMLTLGLGSSWAGRRIAVDRTAWDQARTRWEEIELARSIDVWRYRHGSYPVALAALAEDRIPLPGDADKRWDYRLDGESYRLIRMR